MLREGENQPIGDLDSTPASGIPGPTFHRESTAFGSRKQLGAFTNQKTKPSLVWALSLIGYKILGKTLYLLWARGSPAVT